MTRPSHPPAPTGDACATRRAAAHAAGKFATAVSCSLHGVASSRPCPTLTIYIPTHLPPSGPGEKPKRVDLEPGSALRRFMAEAPAFGVALDVDHALANQLVGVDVGGGCG